MRKLRLAICALACAFLAGGCAARRGVLESSADTSTRIVLETRRMKAVPDRDLGSQVYGAADLYEKADDAYERGAYREARHLLERIPGEFPDSRYVAPAFLLLGTIGVKAEEWGEVERWFGRYLTEYPSSGQSWYAERGLAAAYAAQGRWASAVSVLRRVVDEGELDEDTRDASAFYLARALIELGDLDEGQGMLEALFRRLDPLAQLDDAFPGASDPIAMGHFYLGEIARHRAEAIRIDQVVDLSRTQARLDEKAAYVLEAHGHYYRALTCLDPKWTAAAGYRMGYLYERFYQDVMDAPLPEGIEAEDIPLYYAMLDETLANIVGRARRIYDQALRYADRLDLDPDWVDRCREGLARLESRPWGPSARRRAMEESADAQGPDGG